MSAKYIPTEQERAEVMSWLSAGMTQADVCTVLGITEKTLRRAFKEELATAYAKSCGFVVGKLWQLVESGDKAAIFFWLKTRAGWRETSRL